MSRFLTDDYINRDPRALLNSAKLATLSETAIPEKQYIVVTGTDTLRILEDCIFTIFGGGVFKTEQTELSASNLDIGSAFALGTDYYIYLCDIGGTNDETFVISANSTYPDGYGADNSRKIGGFHYGKCRSANAALEPVNASGVARGTGWVSTVYDGIVPRSVWTLAHRPKCEPEGMVYLGGGLWVDIYLSSDDGAGGLLSAYNKAPMTGTEGANWYTFVERALASGKKLLTYDEFCAAAKGSPQGLANSNTNAWSATTNTGRNNTGLVDYAVSSIGCRDCVGNVWEWTRSLSHRGQPQVLTGSGTFAASDGGRAGQAYTNGNGHGTTGAWGWDTVSPFGDGYGNIYEFYDFSLIALIAGGYWNDGVRAGARAVNLYDYPWIVGTYIGARCACDSL